MRDEIRDQALHVLISVAGLIWIVFQPSSLLPYAFAGFCFRVAAEHAQHFAQDGFAWPFRGDGGRWRDIAFGTLGGAGVGLVALLA